MRAIVTRLRKDEQREKVLVSDRPAPPAPKGNEVQCKALFTGITNGTERNDLIRGNYAHRDEDLPAGWGYQNVARVVRLGPEAKELRKGDVIFASADHVERFNIREDGLLVKLAPEVSPQHAALFGMAGVATHCCRRLDLRMGERLLIVGLGCIGQFAAQIATHMGARVTACDVNEKRLRIARKIGAAEQVFNPAGSGWKDSLRDFSFDAVMDVAGVPDMVDALIGAVRNRGRVLLVAGRFDVKYTFNLGQWHEVGIMQSSHFSRDDLDNLCRLVAGGRVKIGPIVTRVVAAKGAKRIYDTLRDEPHKLMGTVFEW